MSSNLPFSATGLHKPTMTTADDPALKVFNYDNGIQWLLKFYVNGKLIDVIDLEKLVDSKMPWKIVNAIHPSLFDVRVYDDTNRKFTLKSFLEYILFKESRLKGMIVDSSVYFYDDERHFWYKSNPHST